jgi:hypothetical protein
MILFATAKPMPEAPPVITAPRSSNRRIPVMFTPFRIFGYRVAPVRRSFECAAVGAIADRVGSAWSKLGE